MNDRVNLLSFALPPPFPPPRHIKLLYSRARLRFAKQPCGRQDRAATSPDLRYRARRTVSEVNNGRVEI